MANAQHVLDVNVPIKQGDLIDAAEDFFDYFFEDYSNETVQLMGITKKDLCLEISELESFRSKVCSAVKQFGLEAFSSPYDYFDFSSIIESSKELKLLRKTMDFLQTVVDDFDVNDADFATYAPPNSVDFDAAINLLKANGFIIIRKK